MQKFDYDYLKNMIIVIIIMFAAIVMVSCAPENKVYVDDNGVIHNVFDPHNLDEVSDELVMKVYTTRGYQKKSIIGFYNGYIPESGFDFYHTKSDTVAYSITYHKVKPLVKQRQ